MAYRLIAYTFEEVNGTLTEIANFVTVHKNCAIILRNIHDKRFDDVTIKEFSTLDAAKEYAEKHLKNACNIARMVAYNKETKKTTPIFTSFSADELLQGEFAAEAQAFLSSQGGKAYLSNRTQQFEYGMDQLTSWYDTATIYDESVRPAKIPNHLYFVDLYEDNTAQWYITNGLSDLKKELNKALGKTFWVKARRGIVKPEWTIYLGKTKTNNHVVLWDFSKDKNMSAKYARV